MELLSALRIKILAKVFFVKFTIVSIWTSYMARSFAITFFDFLMTFKVANVYKANKVLISSGFTVEKTRVKVAAVIKDHTLQFGAT